MNNFNKWLKNKLNKYNGYPRIPAITRNPFKTRLMDTRAGMGRARGKKSPNGAGDGVVLPAPAPPHCHPYTCVQHICKQNVS